MNNFQRYIINIAVTVMVVMALFPPWNMNVSRGRVIDLGYAPVFLPPTYKQTNLSGTINMETLIVQWVAVIIVAAWGYKMKSHK